MTSPSTRSRLVRRLAACAPLLLLPACATGEQWTFAASRNIYTSDFFEGMSSSLGENPNPGAACAVVVLVALPLAFDVVALPVTLPHDLVTHSRRW